MTGSKDKSQETWLLSLDFNLSNDLYLFIY